jgi:hypothetical protein
MAVSGEEATMSYDRWSSKGSERQGGHGGAVSGEVPGKRTLTMDAPAPSPTVPERAEAGKGAAPRPPKTDTGGGAAKAHEAHEAPAAHEAPKAGGHAAPTLSMSLHQMRASDIPTTPQGGLSYAQVGPLTKSDPGGFNWVVQWKLSGASPAGGWIVQHLKVTADITNKAGKVLAAGEDKDFGYWEAWQVNKGKAVTTYAEKGDTADDAYAYPKSGDDTKGTIKFTGTAEFYEALTLPSSFVADRSQPTGVLPMTRSQPTLSGGTGAISHNLTATWDATAGDKTTKISH